MNSADNNQNTQPHNQTDATSNVLGEAISESEPTSEPKIIDSQVDLTTYQNRIAELEGQVKEAREAHARANAEAYNARNRMGEAFIKRGIKMPITHDAFFIPNRLFEGLT